jgi:DNA-directed RNA polymerase subunit H (RpoH/RPB5)
MNDIVKRVCELRGYEFKDGSARAQDIEVSFYFTEIATQEFVSQLDKNKLSIVLCNKQKKTIRHDAKVEIHNIEALRKALIPNKFCPRFARLAGEELAQMSRYTDKLPILSKDDPMARAYGFGAGDIVKIYRLNGSLYFRKVE